MAFAPVKESTVHKSPEQVVDQQLTAYNSRDLEAYLKSFSDSIEAYLFPDQLVGKGKDRIKEIYGPMFEQLSELHCEIINRIVKDNLVIDHERITGTRQSKPLEAVVIYEVADSKITKMYVIQ